jgi:hypothetical protein
LRKEITRQHQTDKNWNQKLCPTRAHRIHLARFDQENPNAVVSNDKPETPRFLGIHLFLQTDASTPGKTEFSDLNHFDWIFILKSKSKGSCAYCGQHLACCPQMIPM